MPTTELEKRGREWGGNHTGFVFLGQPVTLLGKVLLLCIRKVVFFFSFSFFCGTGLELRAYTLSHSSSTLPPTFFSYGFFEIGSRIVILLIWPPE
jgi:hypothetical protein